MCSFPSTPSQRRHLDYFELTPIISTSTPKTSMAIWRSPSARLRKVNSAQQRDASNHSLRLLPTHITLMCSSLILSPASSENFGATAIQITLVQSRKDFATHKSIIKDVAPCFRVTIEVYKKRIHWHQSPRILQHTDDICQLTD